MSPILTSISHTCNVAYVGVTVNPDKASPRGGRAASSSPVVMPSAVATGRCSCPQTMTQRRSGANTCASPRVGQAQVSGGRNMWLWDRTSKKGCNQTAIKISVA